MLCMQCSWCVLDTLTCTSQQPLLALLGVAGKYLMPELTVSRQDSVLCKGRLHNNSQVSMKLKCRLLPIPLVLIIGSHVL